MSDKHVTMKILDIGTTFWSKEVLDKVGYYCEDYGFYGLGDSDFGMRVLWSKYINYYLYGIKSKHLGHDINDNSEYRKMKWDSLEKHSSMLGKNFKKYKGTGQYYIKPPLRTD